MIAVCRCFYQTSQEPSEIMTQVVSLYKINIFTLLCYSLYRKIILFITLCVPVLS